MTSGSGMAHSRHIETFPDYRRQCRASDPKAAVRPMGLRAPSVAGKSRGSKWSGLALESVLCRVVKEGAR